MTDLDQLTKFLNNAALGRHEWLSIQVQNGTFDLEVGVLRGAVDEIERLRAENARLLAVLIDARDWMHNDGDGRQSKAWHRIDAAIEQKAR